MPTRAFLGLAFALIAWWLGADTAPAAAQAAAWPAPADGTYVVPEFRFADGETMKNLRLHYVTLGTPHRDAAGRVDNAVLVLHGTGGDTNQRQDGPTYLALSLGETGANQYAYMSFTKGSVAERIARSFRVRGRAKAC